MKGQPIDWGNRGVQGGAGGAGRIEGRAMRIAGPALLEVPGGWPGGWLSGR
jgi:hypothetical protein